MTATPARHGSFTSSSGSGFFLSAAMGIPSNGGLGPWHLAIIFALGIYGVDINQGGAFAMIVWGAQTCLLVLLGIYAFVSIAMDKRQKTVR